MAFFSPKTFFEQLANSLSPLAHVEFAQPKLLFLCLTALIPLAIHLLNRSRARKIPFPALEFFLRAEAASRRRLKVRKALILALRTLLFLAVSLALAHPHFPDKSATAATSEGPTPTILVVDSSLSMGAVLANEETAFQRVHEDAVRFLESLPAEDPVALLACTPDRAPLTPPSRQSRHEALALLKTMASGWHGTALDNCIAEAVEVLENENAHQVRLAIASDFARHALDLSRPKSAAISKDLRLVLIGAPPIQEPNLSVDDVTIEQPDSTEGGMWRIRVQVSNHSDQAQKYVSLNLKIDDVPTARIFLDIPPNERAEATFNHRFQKPGPFSGSVELPDDPFPQDNIAFFTHIVPQRKTVLLVNGSPSDSRFHDEAFFVRTAFDDPSSPFRAQESSSLATHLENLENFDAVFLLNIRGLTTREREGLSAYVKNGGGLFISLGDQVDPDAFNRDFKDISPRALRLIKTQGSTPTRGNLRDKDPSGKMNLGGVGLGSVDTSHPALDVFSKEEGEGLLSATFRRYFLAESESEGSDAVTLAEFEDGAPALIAGNLERGRTILFTSSVDRAWNDLPLRPGFLPLIHKLASWLTQKVDVPTNKPVWRSGMSPVIDLSSGKNATEVIAPTGDILPLITDHEYLGKTPGKLDAPGIYRVLGRAEGSPDESPRADEPKIHLSALDFAVNQVGTESDLSQLPREQLISWLSDGASGDVTLFTDTNDDSDFPLATFLLCLAVLCIFAEGLLIRL